MKYRINCPYCFNQFDQKEVLFKKDNAKNEPLFDDQTLINPQKENCELINDADGFVVSVKDSSDNRFNERICPYCHSSLPLMYGKYPVKRIVLTGVTGSGKTVYLSSLLRNIQTYCANVNLSCSIQSPSVNKYVQNNIIEKGKPLPQATSPDQAIESLPITIKFIDDDGIPTRVTIVFYDVAGEEITSSLNNSTIKAIKHADGIMVLQDPNQFETHMMYNSVLQIIINTLNIGSDYCSIPIAFCISKCDRMIDDGMFSDELVELLKKPVKTVDGGFCAVDYNRISKEIDELYRQQDPTTRTALRTYSDCFNYFAVSSLNCKLVVSNENTLVPAETPHLMRLEEPFYWLLNQFGIINSDVDIIDHTLKSE